MTTPTTRPTEVTLDLEAQIAHLDSFMKRHPVSLAHGLFTMDVAILASLIRLREIEGKLREPTPEMIEAGAPYMNKLGREYAEACIRAANALLLRGKP